MEGISRSADFSIPMAARSHDISSDLEAFRPKTMNERDLILFIIKLITQSEAAQSKIGKAIVQDGKFVCMHLTKSVKETYWSWSSVISQGIGAAVNIGGTAFFVVSSNGAGGMAGAQSIMTATQSIASVFQIPTQLFNNANEADRGELTAKRDAVSSDRRFWDEQNTNAGQKKDQALQKADEILRADAEGKRGINQ